MAARFSAVPVKRVSIPVSVGPGGDGLVAGDPARAAAKAVIVTEVERLHWRIWNGKAKNAEKSPD
jgi:hypothetical protein